MAARLDATAVWPLAWLLERLGYQTRDPALFEAALTHRSASGRNNERLEFLGDAVLNMVAADRSTVAIRRPRGRPQPPARAGGQRRAAGRDRRRSSGSATHAAAGSRRTEDRRIPPRVDPGRCARGADRRGLPGSAAWSRPASSSSGCCESRIAAAPEPATLEGRQDPPAGTAAGARRCRCPSMRRERWRRAARAAFRVRCEVRVARRGGRRRTAAAGVAPNRTRRSSCCGASTKGQAH